MRIPQAVHRVRQVLSQRWEMQVQYIEGEGYQATYYHGADPQIWSDTYTTAEQAAYELDKLVDQHFGQDGHYVKVGQVPVPLPLDDAVRFASMWNGQVLTEFRSI